jgi:hypothetical protein
MSAPIEKRLGALERTFGFLIEALVDSALAMQSRLLALQTVLEAKGVLTDPEVAAKMQALSDAAELELEYGDKPELEAFRQLRRVVKDKLAQQPPEGTEP